MEIVISTAVQLVASAILSGGQKQCNEKDSFVLPGGNLPDKLQLTIIKAEKLYCPHWIPKMDPYVCAYLSGSKNKKLRTKPIKWGGKNPKINEMLKFQYQGQQKLVLQVYDYDSLSTDDFIAEAPLDLLPILNSTNREWSGAVEIFGKGGAEQRGILHVSVKFLNGDVFLPHNPSMLSSMASNPVAANAFRSSIISSFAGLPPGASGYAIASSYAHPGSSMPPPPPPPMGSSMGPPPSSMGSSMPPQYGAPPPQYGVPPPPQYGAPPPPQYGAPPPQYGAPPPQYGAPPPQYGYGGYAPPPQSSAMTGSVTTSKHRHH